MSLLMKYMACGVLFLGVSGCQTKTLSLQSKPEPSSQDLSVTGVGSDFEFADAVVELAAKQNTPEELLAFDELIKIAQKDGEWQGFEIALLKKLLKLKEGQDLTYYHYSASYADLVRPSSTLIEKIKTVLENIE